MTYFKVLNEDGSCCSGGGTGSWPLPLDGKPGAWTERVTVDPMTKAGYHVCELADLPYWLGPAIFEAELSGVVIPGDKETMAERGRLVRRLEEWNVDSARCFARDCAARATELHSDSDWSQDANEAAADLNPFLAARWSSEFATWATNPGDLPPEHETESQRIERRWQTGRLRHYLNQP